MGHHQLIAWIALLASMGLTVAGVAPVRPESQVNTYTTPYQFLPSVAMSGSGGFVVTWTSKYGQDGSSGGVFGQIFDSAGTPMASEFQVNTYTASYQASPPVAMGGSGEFVVA
jgi:hypothetical protein